MQGKMFFRMAMLGGAAFFLCNQLLFVNANSVSSGDFTREGRATVSGGDMMEVDTPDGDEAEDEVLLLLPTRIDFMIDPWEVGGHKQIYSSVFMVQNTGTSSGWLNISGISLMLGEESEVCIWTAPEGIRDDTMKNIYMEMQCSSGDVFVLSEVEQECHVFLAPGEVFEFEFSGEVNQYSSEKWKGKDVSVHMIYSWESEV